MPALLLSLCARAFAQDGEGLRLYPSKTTPPGTPYFTVDTDEQAQARRVFRSALWRAFLETVGRESVSPPEPDLMAAECRRSIGYARLTSTELLIDQCISDALARIDPVASYTNPQQHMRRLREQRRPPAAMGLELPARKREHTALTVVGVIEGGPAAMAGIREGDVIESVDDLPISPLTLDDALDALRGPEGSTARVRLLRNGMAVDVLVRREIVRLKATRVRHLGDTALYVRISQFREGAVASALSSELLPVLATPSRRLPLVVDLRANGGGSLAEVVATASLFVPPGAPLFSVSSRNGVQPHVATPSDLPQLRQIPALLKTVPLVVLVDGGTGSGAEAFARVLRDQAHATVLGEPTAGIDNVLGRFELNGEATALITIGHIVSAADGHRHKGGVPLDLLLTGSQAEFGDVPRDTLLAAALEILGPGPATRTGD